MDNQNERRASSPVRVGDMTVRATALSYSAFHVAFEVMSVPACFSTYMTAADARALAAGLIAAADHYDAETARIAAMFEQAADEVAA